MNGGGAKQMTPLYQFAEGRWRALIAEGGFYSDFQDPQRPTGEVD